MAAGLREEKAVPPPSYIHPYQDTRGCLCNLGIRTPDSKDNEIKTDRVTFASWSPVFSDIVTLGDEPISLVTLDYPSAVVSAAFWITANAKNPQRDDPEEEHVEDMPPFSVDVDWMISLLTFAMGYQLPYVMLFCFRWMDPDNRTYSVPDVLKIRKVAKMCPDSPEGRDLLLACCESFLVTNAKECLTLVTEPLPSEQKEVVQMICKSQKQTIEQATIIQELWSLSNGGECGRTALIEKFHSYGTKKKSRRRSLINMMKQLHSPRSLPRHIYDFVLVNMLGWGGRSPTDVAKEILAVLE